MSGDRASEVLERLHSNLNVVPGSETIQTEADKTNSGSINISDIVSFFEEAYGETKALFESFDIELLGIEVLESGIVFLRSKDKIPEDLIRSFNETFPSQIVFVPKGRNSIMARIES